MNLRAFSIAAVATVLLAGCATTSKVLISQPRPAIAPEQVRGDFSPPTGRYGEIALLESSSGAFTYGEQNKLDSVLGKLRVEAAGLGANGVLVQDMASGHGGSNVGVGVGGGSGSYGRGSHVGGGIGVSISPTPKYARAIAIHVDNPPRAELPAVPPPRD